MATRVDGGKFPGLTVKTTTTTGVKMVIHPQTQWPVYECTTISSHQTAEGLAAAVWIFNKLTQWKTETRCLCHFGIQPDDATETFSFQANVSLAVIITFPTFLRRILPHNLEKAERMGGASVKKVVDKYLEQALKSIEHHYEVMTSSDV